jgi:hypothetical protein
MAYRNGKADPKTQTYQEWLVERWIIFLTKAKKVVKIAAIVVIVCAVLYACYYFTGPNGCGCHD